MSIPFKVLKSLLRLSCIVLGIALAACVGNVPSGGESEVTAFVDVNVVPMDASGLLEHQTVIVFDGIVSVVGPSSTTEIPEHANVIDGANRFLLPGLADMHVHISNLDEFVLFIAMGLRRSAICTVTRTSLRGEAA